MVGLFLVSVFSSLLFLCFFFDKGELIVFLSQHLCLALRKGFFFFTTALNECFLRTLLTVSEETGWEIIVLMCLVTRVALAALPVAICDKIAC